MNEDKNNNKIEPENENNNEEMIDEDIVPETDSDNVSGQDIKEKIEALKAKLKACEKEKQEYLDGWQRARADFVNLRKRDEEEKKEFVKFANERLLEEIVPVLDSFEIAFSNKEAWEQIDKNWRVGVECIYSQLKSVLESQGIKEVNPAGLPFDITRDEVSEYVPVQDESEDNKIVAVIKKGYTLNGKLIRPTKVKVGEYKKQS